MRCGLLGQTLAHSHSPLLHSLLGDYAYTLFEKAPDQVEDFLKNGSWDGLNVTIPYKKTAYALCDSLSPIARETGNVNTLLRRRDGSIFGDNTDAFGFRYLLEKAGVPVAGKRALVLGAGGAGGTACAVLRQMGAAVTVLSRTEKPDDFYGKNNGILYSTYRHISQYKDAQIIVNATPVGMYPHNGEAAVDLEIFPRRKASCGGKRRIWFSSVCPAAERLPWPGCWGRPQADRFGTVTRRSSGGQDCPSRMFLTAGAKKNSEPWRRRSWRTWAGTGAASWPPAAAV